MGLRDIGLGRNGADEAAHELDVAVDIALEFRLDQADLRDDFGAPTLVEELPVLPVGIDAEQDDDDRGDRRGHVRRSKQPFRASGQA